MRIGIDLGGTKIEGIVMDDQGQVILRKRIPTPQTDGYTAVLNTIFTLITELETRAYSSCSIGIATPGALSPDTQLLRNSNTTCLNGHAVHLDLQTLLNREIRIANDANCFTLSEAIDGAARGANVVFGIIIGTGTGGGIVVNGKLLDGLQNICGEWGHNPLGTQGRPCYCGRKDCVETYLSGAGLVQTWRHAGGADKLNAIDISALANKNEKLATTVVQRYCEYFSRALASVINILDPDVIVLGGGLSNIDTLYSEGLTRLKPHVMTEHCQSIIVKNQHGDSSGVRGAAWLWDA